VNSKQEEVMEYLLWDDGKGQFKEYKFKTKAEKARFIKKNGEPPRVSDAERNEGEKFLKSLMKKEKTKPNAVWVVQIDWHSQIGTNAVYVFSSKSKVRKFIFELCEANWNDSHWPFQPKDKIELLADWARGEDGLNFKQCLINNVEGIQG
jgi:hypothetical protein